MMNPQYMPPGQNNNAPNNPMNFPPTSQDYNGVQNANFQQPPNGSHDVSQKMQAMNLNGPAGYLPPGQLPPGAIPPTSFAPGQLPPGMNRGPGAPFPQMGPPPMPPSSAPGGQSQMQGPPKPSQPGLQGPAQNGQMPPVSQQQARSGIPPQSGLPQQPGMPPHPGQGPSRPMQSGQTPGFQPQAQPRPGQLPPHSQPGLPPHSQPGPVSSQQGMPPSSQPGQMSLPPQPQGQMPQSGQQGLPQQAQQSQPGFSPQSRPQQQPYPGQQQIPGQPPMPGQTPISSQSSMPGQAPILGQQQMSGPQGQLPGQPPMQQRQMPGQPPMPGQQGQMPSQQGPMPSQQGQMPSQQGPMPGLQGQMRGQQGQMPTQQGQMPGQPPMPVQQGQMPGQPPMPGQQGQMPGQPPMPGQQGQMPGQPPMPGQQGQMPGQPPMPGQQGQMTNQPQYQMPGMPHMPPPLAQRQQFPGMPNQPGYGPPSGYQGQPPMPGQPSMPGQPPMHGQPPLPGQPPMSGQHIPGHPPMPGQQMPGQPPMPGQQMPGLPPMPGQQMPGQPPMPGQQMPGQPPMPYQQQQSGYPPQYGQQPPYPGQQPSYPGQQQKRLDPDQMPSPIQVMSDDQQNREGVFVTNEKGAVPPLVTTDFTVDDKGNASPRFIRSSMYSVPVTADLLKQTAMPFCLVISPMAELLPGEQSPPLLDFAALTGSPTMGPVRCSRCKAYMCPNMKFIDAGRHFKCCFCKATTEVPMEYTQYVNSMQQYGRVPAEMALGAYELVATKEYCRNNTLPNAPAIVFILDVSYNSIKNGLLHTVCNNILDIIQSFPKDEQTGKCPTRVGIITYSSTVHFYNIKGTLAQPQMLSVGDVGDMFVPILEGFLVTAEDSGSVLPQLLQQLPQMFEGNKETETILLPAVQAGMEALKAADTSGQLLVFHTSLPSYNAPGKLINREDRKLLGTEKEKQILSPQTTAYNELGQSCSQAGVSVELFVCNNSYVDVATIGQLPRLTGGATHKYTYFTSELDGGRLVCDVRRVTSRGTAHDAVMRVRTSTGVRPTDFYGHMFMSNTSDVELAAVDADKAIAIEIKHDDKLTGEDGVYIQAALLYTHRSSQRRLRVLNLALNVAHQLADVYRCVELDTAVNFLTKQAVWALREHSPRQVREGLSSRCAKSLAAYRKHCASPSSAGQLVLPESMKLLPLYTSCILRSDAVAGGPDLTCDDRSCAMYRALTADVCMSVVYTYPRLLPLHRVGEVSPLPALRASVDKMRDHGVYLLENGVHMLLWVGSQASPDFVRDVFGVPSPQQIDTQVCELPELDNPASEAVRASVQHARTIRRNAMRLTIMRQHDKLEAVLRHFLVEDRGVDGSASYVDYLCHVHKEIRALL